MPVLSHANSNLTIDVFDSALKIPNVEHYCHAKDILYYTTSNLVFKRNLLDNISKEIYNVNSSIYTIETTRDGEILVILEKNSKLTLIVKEKEKLVLPNVFKFCASDKILAYENDKELIILNLDTLKVFHKSLFNYKEFVVFDDFCLVSTDKCKTENIYKILKISEKEEIVLHKFKSFISSQVKLSKDKNYILMNVSTSYVKNSYYASTILYFFDLKNKKVKEIKNLVNILDFTFLNEGFCVIHGNQPSESTNYNFKIEIVDKYPKSVKNKIFFNHQLSHFAFAGFDQLAGDIEIYDTKTKVKTCSINEFGANKIEWDNSGSYFYVSTPNYLADDSRIVKYDYYGRKIASVKYDLLQSCAVYGKNSSFIKLQPAVVKSEEEEIYTPPGLVKPKVAKKQPLKQKKLEVVLSVEDLTKELQNIQELKMKNKQKLLPSELNLILKEDKIIEALNKLKKVCFSF